MSAEVKGLDMVAIKEYEAMIVDGRKVTEDLCLEIIEMGEGLKGYGLFLAKEQVHAESKTGWDKFLKKVGIGRSMAHDTINFYKAKSSAMADELPNKERTFRALTGETVQDKADQYAKVKELTHKEEPTALDIRLVAKVNNRGSSDEARREGIENLNTASPKVREAFVKDTKPAVKRMNEAFSQNLTDNEIIEELGDRTGKTEKVKSTKKERETANKSLTDKIAKLEKENKELKAKNKELEALAEYHERIGAFKVFYLGLSDSIRVLKRIKAMSERAIVDMSPQIKQAYEILGVELKVTDESMRLIKKAYRAKAKELHPDLGGDADYFMQVKEAYEDLKEFHEEIGVS